MTRQGTTKPFKAPKEILALARLAESANLRVRVAQKSLASGEYAEITIAQQDGGLSFTLRVPTRARKTLKALGAYVEYMRASGLL